MAIPVEVTATDVVIEETDVDAEAVEAPPLPPPPPPPPSEPRPDPIDVPGLGWALVSLVTPPEWGLGGDRGNCLAVKVRGAFGSLDEAKAHADKLVGLDPGFSVYIMQMYNWCPIRPAQAAAAPETPTETPTEPPTPAPPSEPRSPPPEPSPGPSAP